MSEAVVKGLCFVPALSSPCSCLVQVVRLKRRVLILKSGALPDLRDWSLAPNVSFSEFERRISASGTFSASAWGQTEFKLQRIRVPNFGIRHIYGFSLEAPGGRPNLSFSEFERRTSASAWGQTECKFQRIRAPNFGVRHIFGFSLEADRI